MEGISRAKIKSVKQTIVVILGYVVCSAPAIIIQLWKAWIKGEHQLSKCIFLYNCWKCFWILLSEGTVYILKLCPVCNIMMFWYWIQNLLRIPKIFIAHQLQKSENNFIHFLEKKICFWNLLTFSTVRRQIKKGFWFSFEKVLLLLYFIFQINVQIGIIGWWPWTVLWILGYTYHLIEISNYHFTSVVVPANLPIIAKQVLMKTSFYQKIKTQKIMIFWDRGLLQRQKLK